MDNWSMKSNRAAVAPASPRLMKNEYRPEWGVGLVVRDLPNHWELFFQHGGPRKFVKDMAACLTPGELPADELAILEEKARARQASLGAGPGLKARTRSSGPAVVKARFDVFEDQLAVFEKLFPGGFEGEAFIEAERGSAKTKAKKGHKEGAITLARSELSQDSFKNGSPAALFDSVIKVLKATNMVFPMEGAIPLLAVPEEDRANVVKQLKELIYGTGEYGDRLAAFASAVKLQDKKGAPKAVTWPLATIFPALCSPKKYVCVKPTAFTSQAAGLGLNATRAQAVNAGGYERFLEVAEKTQERLEAASQKPRDLLDVYSFICTTHRAK